MLVLRRKVPRNFEYENNMILVEKQEGIAIVTLNNPPMNLCSIASMTELLQDLRLLEYDPEVRVVILTGTGTRAFNAGSNVKEMPAMTGGFRDEKFNLENDLYATLDELPKPTICAIEGICMGGGLELACACDIRVASAEAKFSMPEIKLGLVPGAGGMFRLPKIIGPAKTLEMLYTGMTIDAGEAHRIGLVNHICAPGDAVKTAWPIAQTIAGMPPKNLRVMKRFVMENAFKPNEDVVRKNLAYVDDIFEDYNAMEGIAAFVEKRDPNFLLDDEEVLN